MDKTSILFIFAVFLFFSATAYAQKESPENVSSRLNKLEASLSSLEGSQKTILQKLDQILQELDTIRVRIRRT